MQRGANRLLMGACLMMKIHPIWEVAILVFWYVPVLRPPISVVVLSSSPCWSSIDTATITMQAKSRWIRHAGLCGWLHLWNPRASTSTFLQCVFSNGASCGWLHLWLWTQERTSLRNQNLQIREMVHFGLYIMYIIGYSPIHCTLSQLSFFATLTYLCLDWKKREVYV